MGIPWGCSEFKCNLKSSYKCFNVVYRRTLTSLKVLAWLFVFLARHLWFDLPNFLGVQYFSYLFSIAKCVWSSVNFESMVYLSCYVFWALSFFFYTKSISIELDSFVNKFNDKTSWIQWQSQLVGWAGVGTSTPKDSPRISPQAPHGWPGWSNASVWLSLADMTWQQ